MNMRTGQVLIVTILILGVIATVGLSIATRSTTELAVSTTVDESSRALEAAEVGLERYLGGVPHPTSRPEWGGGGSGNVPDTQATYVGPTPLGFGGGKT